MIKVTSNISATTVRLGAWIAKIGGAGRKLLYSAAANAVAIRVRSHLSRLGRPRAAPCSMPTGVAEK